MRDKITRRYITKYAGQIINITLLEMQDKNSVNYKHSFKLKTKTHVDVLQKP